MPVWRATDPKVDVNASGKQRRHINPHCPLYAQVPTTHRCKTDGVPNTERVQANTVRCEHPDCWEKRVKEDANKKRSSTGKGRASASKAAATPTAPGSAKAQSLADRAKAARQRPKSKAKASA